MKEKVLYQKLKENKNNYSKTDWENFSFLDLSENIIREFADYLDWSIILTHSVLSEDFIREFIHKIETKWFIVCLKQKLSEDFIIEFQHKPLNWIYISWGQKLSIDFITKFKNKISWTHIIYNLYIDDEVYLKFYDKINWRNFYHFRGHSLYEKIFKKMKSPQKLYILLNYRELFL